MIWGCIFILEIKFHKPKFKMNPVSTWESRIYHWLSIKVKVQLHPLDPIEIKKFIPPLAWGMAWKDLGTKTPHPRAQIQP